MSITTIYKCDACGATKEHTDQGPSAGGACFTHDVEGWGALDVGNGLDVSFMLCDGCIAKVAERLGLKIQAFPVSVSEFAPMVGPGKFVPFGRGLRRRVPPTFMAEPAPPMVSEPVDPAGSPVARAADQMRAVRDLDEDDRRLDKKIIARQIAEIDRLEHEMFNLKNPPRRATPVG